MSKTTKTTEKRTVAVLAAKAEIGRRRNNKAAIRKAVEAKGNGRKLTAKQRKALKLPKASSWVFSTMSGAELEALTEAGNTVTAEFKSGRVVEVTAV